MLRPNSIDCHTAETEIFNSVSGLNDAPDAVKIINEGKTIIAICL